MNSENLPILERRYTQQTPYYEQLASWREGMRYRYSPDMYLITQNQFVALNRCGALMGEMLDRSLGEQILEFRVDFVCGKDDKLYATEVQTDDRGFPAMLATRNATGTPQPELLSGVAAPLVAAMERTVGKPNFDLLITYDDYEQFYYSGFSDVSRILWDQNPRASFLVAPRSAIATNENSTILTVPNEGVVLQIKPDLIWNFSSDPLPGRVIQPMVNKQVLLDAWRSEDPLYRQLREFIPEARPIDFEGMKDEKNDWILKPLDGKWSRGITIGPQVSEDKWRKALRREEGLIAQRYIPPRTDWLTVRKKKSTYSTYSEEPLYSRVEGYYCRTPQGWKLVDVLATCTPDIPVHGKRDCIMIPGVIADS